jgi:hypothetical protein
MSSSADLFNLVRKKKWDHVVERAGIFPEEASVHFTFTFKNGVSVGTLPIHVACMKQAPIRVIHALLAADPTSCNEADGIGRTPLHNAVRYGASFKVASILLAAGPKAVRAKAYDGNLPIHYACKFATSLVDHLPIIKNLLWLHPDSVWEKDASGETPKDSAAHNTNLILRDHIVHLLDCFKVEILDVDTRNDSAGFRTTAIGGRVDSSSSSSSSSSEGSSVSSNNLYSNNATFSQMTESNSCVRSDNDELITNSNNKNESKTKQCVVCLEKDVTMVLIPCGHPCLCESCASPSIMNRIKWKCPECRTEIHQVIKFFGRIASEE